MIEAPQSSRYAKGIGYGFVVIENGASSRADWLPVVLGDLVTLGFDAEWHCLPASAVGAPHQRDRCFVVAHTSRDRLQKRSKSINDESALSVLGYRGRPPVERLDWWKTEPAVGRVAHGVPRRVDRIRCLGNAVVPSVAEEIGKIVLRIANQSDR